MPNLPVFRSLSIALFLLSLLFLLRPAQILAVCEFSGNPANCDASTPEVNEMFCPGSGSLYCVGADSATGQSCPVCIAASGGGTCSDDRDDSRDNNFNWQFFAEQACREGITQPCVSGSDLDVVCSVSGTEGSNVTLQNSCLGQRAITAGVITMGQCDPGTDCNGFIYSPDPAIFDYRNAKYCVAPTCNFDRAQNNGETGIDCGGGGCPACSSLSCSVTSATPTSSTTADAVSDDTGGDVSGYDRADWFLNGTYIGATAINTTNGTSSNTFTNLVAGTQYNLGAHYVDTEGGRPAVSCTGYTFQFNPPSTQTTCSLSASPQSLNIGGSSTWTLTSSNAPSGSTAWWNGTVTGQVSGWTPNSTYTQTILYNNSGSDSRYVDIKNSSGTTLCTTDTVQVYVNPNNCSALSVTPSSLNLTVGGTGSLTASGINGSISSWSSSDTSIATV